MWWLYLDTWHLLHQITGFLLITLENECTISMYCLTQCSLTSAWLSQYLESNHNFIMVNFPHGRTLASKKRKNISFFGLVPSSHSPYSTLLTIGVNTFQIRDSWCFHFEIKSWTCGWEGNGRHIQGGFVRQAPGELCGFPLCFPQAHIL